MNARLKKAVYLRLRLRSWEADQLGTVRGILSSATLLLAQGALRNLILAVTDSNYGTPNALIALLMLFRHAGTGESRSTPPVAFPRAESRHSVNKITFTCSFLSRRVEAMRVHRTPRLRGLGY